MPRRPVDDDENGPNTPQVSGSYTIFADAARAQARTVGRVVLLLTKRIDLRDPERIAMLEELVQKLLDLADAFDAWPTLPPGRLAWERQHRVAELKRALKTAAEVIEEVPTRGALGKVRFPK